MNKRKDLCSKCGVPKTPENTTLHKKRGYLPYCKQCASDVVIKRNASPMSNEELAQKILKYERILKILKEGRDERF